MGKDHVRPKRRKLRCLPANVGGIGSSPSHIDLEVGADGPAQQSEFLQERSDARLKLRIVRGCGHDYADAPHPFALLRPHRERPSRRRATEHRDELAPCDHSITSSAMARRFGGIAMSKILAVCKLMTSSNLLARR